MTGYGIAFQHEGSQIFGSTTVLPHLTLDGSLLVAFLGTKEQYHEAIGIPEKRQK